MLGIDPTFKMSNNQPSKAPNNQTGLSGPASPKFNDNINNSLPFNQTNNNTLTKSQIDKDHLDDMSKERRMSFDEDDDKLEKSKFSLKNSIKGSQLHEARASKRMERISQLIKFKSSTTNKETSESTAKEDNVKDKNGDEKEQSAWVKTLKRIPLCLLLVFYLFIQLQTLVSIVMFLEGQLVLQQAVKDVCDENPNSIFYCPDGVDIQKPITLYSDTSTLNLITACN